MKSGLLIYSIAALAVHSANSHNANAESVTTKTHVQPQQIKNAEAVDFSTFDENGDGIFTINELGENLFYLFDQDGNEVIDNSEWDKRTIYTVTPMQKETFKFVDNDGDGETDISEYSREEFYQASGLIRFDADKNGLSPSEFIGTGFQTLDDNDNNMIEVTEWKKSYTQSLVPESANPKRYN